MRQVQARDGAERTPARAGRLRAAGVLAGFLGLTVPLMPLQALLVRQGSGRARTFPHWYHRRVCRLLGIRLTVEGAVAAGRPVLLVANHTSWLDIPVLSAVAPVSFVAKKEVGTWPFVSALARLQRTVFVDRGRRTTVAGTAEEMLARLRGGDALVLFAEGTSSDGNRVLPFMTSLFGVAGAAGAEGAPPGAVVQAVTLAYTHLHGLPLGRADRPRVGWYGDMEMQSHAWELLKAGPLDVHVRIGPPRDLAEAGDRKALARASEEAVRESLVRILRGLPEGGAPLAVRPAGPASVPRPGRRGDGDAGAPAGWT